MNAIANLKKTQIFHLIKYILHMVFEDYLQIYIYITRNFLVKNLILSKFYMKMQFFHKMTWPKIIYILLLLKCQNSDSMHCNAGNCSFDHLYNYTDKKCFLKGGLHDNPIKSIKIKLGRQNWNHLFIVFFLWFNFLNKSVCKA